MSSNNSIPIVYDFAFLGLGCGNSLLILEMERKGLLIDKKIVVFEPEKKMRNDKTFCFWMDPAQLHTFGIQDLIRDKWTKVSVVNDQKQTLNKVHYFHIPALSLYQKVSNLLTTYQIETLCISYTGSFKHERNYSTLNFSDRIIHAKYIFDNRPPSYVNATRNEVQLFQSFYGWEIKALNKSFDIDTFTMMDFNVPQEGSTQFMYVLPFNQNTALFEITRFGEELIEKETAENTIHNYLQAKGIDYEIEQTEHGVIRMFNSHIIVDNSHSNVINTGERGGRLKPSTGYSFIRSLNHARQITNGLLENKTYKVKNSRRFSYYDRLLLQILKYTPNRGKEIFTQLFSKNNVETVLRFLDEKSSPKEELAIFASLPLPLFIAAFLRDCFCMISNRIILLPPIIWMSILSLLAYTLGLEWFVYAFLILGLFLVGIPHGAVDHLYTLGNPSPGKLILHVFKYLGLGSLVLMLFWLSPDIGLIFFLLYSSWHFGETDFTYWKLSGNRAAAAWGIYLLGGLLLSHVNEMQLVVQQMSVHVTFNSSFSSEVSNIWIIVGGLYFIVKEKKNGIFFGMLALLILQYLPLIPAFALFFIGQHSMHGWSSLKTNLEVSNFKLWWKALPFTLGAFFLLLVTTFFTTFNWGQVFIFLAALSFPHVYYTTRFNFRKPESS